MAVSQATYVERWDSAEFPFHRERNGLVRYHQRVVVTAEGEVLSGHLAIANAVAESWCSDNPTLFEALIEEWMNDARAADDEARKFSEKWDERLQFNPNLAAALERGLGVVCERAGLTAFQTRAVELFLDGKTPTEIAHALGLNSRQAAQDRISKALERIVGIDEPA